MTKMTRAERIDLYDRACARVPADETPAEFTGRFNRTIQQIKAEEAEQRRFHLDRQDFIFPAFNVGLAALFGLGYLASELGMGRDAFGLLAVVLLVAAAFVGLRLMAGRRRK